MVERDTKGRWLPGHKNGGPGRPPREREIKYLKALTGRITLKQWKAIIDNAIGDAMAGDRHARDWLSKYLLPAATMEGDAVPVMLHPVFARTLGLNDE